MLGPADREKLARRVLHGAILNRPFNQFQACECGSEKLASWRRYAIGIIRIIRAAKNSTGEVTHASPACTKEHVLALKSVVCLHFPFQVTAVTIQLLRSAEESHPETCSTEMNCPI